MNYYKNKKITIKKLNKKDRKIATNILGIEIDALNVKIILRYKSLMTDPANIKKNLMPSASINEKILNSAIKAPDVKSTLQCFLKAVETKHQVYQDLFAKLVKESDSPISRLEFILETAPIEMSYFEFKKNMRYYNIGYILAFINMKWIEIKNLRCIINAMARNVRADQTLDLLVSALSQSVRSGRHRARCRWPAGAGMDLLGVDSGSPPTPRDRRGSVDPGDGLSARVPRRTVLPQTDHAGYFFTVRRPHLSGATRRRRPEGRAWR